MAPFFTWRRDGKIQVNLLSLVILWPLVLWSGHAFTMDLLIHATFIFTIRTSVTTIHVFSINVVCSVSIFFKSMKRVMHFCICWCHKNHCILQHLIDGPNIILAATLHECLHQLMTIHHCRKQHKQYVHSMFCITFLIHYRICCISPSIDAFKIIADCSISRLHVIHERCNINSRQSITQQIVAFSLSCTI